MKVHEVKQIEFLIIIIEDKNILNMFVIYKIFRNAIEKRGNYSVGL